ncbi:MAG: ABC transporter permease [Alphaproteobacteria bacterium]|nr:ABC transporter permease [Alphaproteobacteria bacterium]
MMHALTAPLLRHSAHTRGWHRFLEHRPAAISAVVLAVLVLLAACQPLIVAAMGHDPDAVDLLARFEPPSWGHLLGTDELGRDVFLRLLAGGRVSLFVGVIAALIGTFVGTLVGICAGYYGGRIDSILMRTTDAVIALPLLPVLIVVAAIDPAKLGIPEAWRGGDGADLTRIVVIIALFGWTTVARLVRGAALALREQEFVRAATALGATPLRIMRVHLLPNMASPIIVATTLSVGHVILFESVLSFLGLGIQPPRASWGNMLTGAQELIWSAPMLVVYPGMLIFVTVMAFNFLGDGLQHALDPRATRRGERRTA